MLKENIIALSVSIKKVERSYTVSLASYLEALDQKGENILKRSRQQEIITLRDKNQTIETKELYKYSTKLVSLRKSRI